MHRPADRFQRLEPRAALGDVNAQALRRGVIHHRENRHSAIGLGEANRGVDAAHRVGPLGQDRAVVALRLDRLRLMRENDLLAPQRQPQPVEPKRHDGTILAERPNQIWGIDATVGFTQADGRVTIFAMVDHATAECLGIHVAKRGTRFEALEPVRRAVREQFGGFAEGVACGVRLRHDHGSQFMSDDFQSEIAFVGITSSPAFVREPEGNGCVERFFRTLKEQLLWVRDFTTLEELAEALEQFRQRYHDQWLLERLRFQSPRQAPQGCLPSRLLHDDGQKNSQKTGCGRYVVSEYVFLLRPSRFRARRQESLRGKTFSALSTTCTTPPQELPDLRYFFRRLGLLLRVPPPLM